MKTRKINFYLIFIPILLSFIAILQASWVLFDSTPVQDNDNPLVDNSSKIEIGIKYVAYIDLELIPSEPEIAHDGQTSIDQVYIIDDSETEYNRLSNLLSNNTNVSIESLNSAKQYEVNLKDSDYIYIIDVSEAISKTTSSGLCGGTGTTTYKGKYTICKKLIEKAYASEMFDGAIMNKIIVPINSKFPYQTAQESLTLEKSNYVFFGFYNEAADGSPGTTPIDNGTIVSTSCNVYAYFINTQKLSNFSNITNTISANTSTVNIFVGADSDSCNVEKDASYFNKLNTFSLGAGLENLEIKSGSTVNFCLNTGDIYKESTSSKKNQYINAFDETHHCQYIISLQTDLVINGTLQIGSHYGGGSNNGIQGNINDEFVCLDLNGKTITINNNATLNSYGLIRDTVGTGKIIVNGGGKLETLGVIYDYKGGQSTMQCKSLNVVPFNNYSIPYLQCKIVFKYTNNLWGSVSCLIRVHTTASAVIPVHLNLAGQGSGFLFILNDGAEDSKIIFESIENELLSKNSYTMRNGTNRKINMKFYNCDLDFSNLEINAGATIDTKDLYFPICSFFNLSFYNSKFTFNQPIQFMFGSSVYLDESSELIFSYDSKTTATLSVLNETVDKIISDTSIVQIHRYNVSQIPVINNFWNNLDTWKYSNESIITCKGTTYFNVNVGTDNTNPYILGGKINLNKIGYIDLNGNKNVLNDFSFSELSANGVNIQTYVYDYIPSNYSYTSAPNLIGYSLPLITYDNAIVFNNQSDLDLLGTFDKTTGLLTIGNKTYYFNVDDTVTTKRTISLRECSYDENTHLIKDTSSGSYYAFFNNVFLPVTTENNVVNCNPQRITASSTNITITYNETYKYWSR